MSWTGKVRSSLVQLDEVDGEVIEKLILKQADNGKTYPVDESKFKKFVTQRVRRANKN